MTLIELKRIYSPKGRYTYIANGKRISRKEYERLDWNAKRKFCCMCTHNRQICTIEI